MTTLYVVTTPGGGGMGKVKKSKDLNYIYMEVYSSVTFCLSTMMCQSSATYNHFEFVTLKSGDFANCYSATCPIANKILNY